ncbi:hypothetical protein [Nitrospirillum sp. BR 11828]|uniref:hypothetical protein n=1 Tax=Nitrospirillum sp. BR 11828 TaxID=3104325 RepID=UPI002ACAC780|nr:hypothetical protein [Nitrospirillum sp. BR 11828]MDZ5648836.1 hypothetical protein [Nitrospirillum sp. BR 11828]
MRPMLSVLALAAVLAAALALHPTKAAPHAIALSDTPVRITLAADSAAAQQRGDRLVLAIWGLKADKAPGAGLILTLNLPRGATPAPEDPGYVGAVSFFGAETLPPARHCPAHRSPLPPCWRDWPPQAACAGLWS